MSAMERGHEGQMQKVTVTEDQVLGEASQECSRHDQFRLGVVRSQIKERTPASCSSPGVARPSPGQEETGSRSWAQWQHPWSWLLLRCLGVDLGTGHWEPQAGHVRTLRGRDVRVDRTTPGRLQTAASPSSRCGTRCLYFLILIPIVQFSLNTFLSGFCLWLLSKSLSCEQVASHLHITKPCVKSQSWNYFFWSCHSLGDLGSLTRDWTHTLGTESMES